MRKLLSSTLLLLAFAGKFHAQAPVTLCLGEDATVCAGTPVTINNCSTGGIGGVGSAGLFMNAPTNVSLSDDVYSGVVNIGFTFNFYNNNYTQLVIGSNGLVSFDLAKANNYCAWALGGIGTLPNATFADARNSAMGCYQDINPGIGGQVSYQTIGTAPFRKFLVLYREVPTFSCAQCSYLAIVLYETSNIVEFHIGNKPPCPNWNGGLAIQGTENSTGTIAHVTPGRNNTAWSANQDGKRYTPGAPGVSGGYTITTVPYLLVYSAGTGMGWANTLGQTFPYNNGVLPVPVVPAGTTGYFLTGSACGASIGSITQDTTWLTRVSATVTATSTPDICSSSIGTVTAVPGVGMQPFTYTWPTLAASGATVTGVPAGTYTVNAIDGMGCPATASVTVGDTPAAFTSSSTLVSCPGGSDGTATATMTPLLGNVTYLWDDPLQQTTQTATGLAAGTYNCTVISDVGCQDITTVVVSEIPGMISTIGYQTNATCNSGSNGTASVVITQGTAPYTYSWDQSVSTTNSANDLIAADHTLTITDANGCVITQVITIGEPPALEIQSITPPTQICPEADIELDVTGIGGSSTYTFTWSENGTQIGTGASITVDPEFTNTQYCVVLSEACGSPTDDTCILIYFPTPIVPNITPNKLEDCTAAFFEFTNSSSNGGEIATTFFEFTDGTSIMEQGADSTSNWFEIPSLYSANMTITSIYGCVYTGSFIDFIEVLPLPVADFTFSTNPATFFETTIQLQDRSSFDVIDWQWLSPGSSPSYSNSQNPVFNFPEGVVGVYPVTLIVTTEYGCTDTVTIDMNIIQDVIFYAPNTFTPDGDEHNQSWEIFVAGLDIYDFELFIYNRWGEVIWESHDVTDKWDGTYGGNIVPQGTYVWIARGKDTVNDNKFTFSGHINVLK
jgi:gliding motility-associated-like protein